MNAGNQMDMIIRNARLLDDSEPKHIGIAQNRIVEIGNAINATAITEIDADNELVTQSFTDPHFHLDKVLSRDIFGANNFEEAFSKAHEVKKSFTVSDVEERACRALELAVAQGMGKMRAQVDVDFATGLVSFEGILRAREKFKDAIDIQIVAFPQEGIVTDPKAPALLREAISQGADLLGGLPEFEASEDDQVTHIKTIFDIAEETGVKIDMHADYTDKPGFKTLEIMADETIARGLQGHVVANHCNALAVYSDAEAKRVIEKLKQAEMQVAVLPIANLQMLGGVDRTPSSRGSSRINELLDAGVNVAAGADNMYDIWFRFNRMDPIDVGYITCLSGGMRTDEEVRESFEMITSRANRYIGVNEGGVRVGEVADLVVHSAGTLVDIYRNIPGKRTHIKNGKIVGGVDGNTWTNIK